MSRLLVALCAVLLFVVGCSSSGSRVPTGDISASRASPYVPVDTSDPFAGCWIGKFRNSSVRTLSVIKPHTVAGAYAVKYTWDGLVNRNHRGSGGGIIEVNEDGILEGKPGGTVLFAWSPSLNGRTMTLTRAGVGVADLVRCSAEVARRNGINVERDAPSVAEQPTAAYTS